MKWNVRNGGYVLASLLFVGSALGSDLSIGPNGINSAGFGLNGMGVGIGQTEEGRPGLPGVDAPADVHNAVTPAGVFRRAGAANAADIEQHAEQVAGIMISTDPMLLAGVAPAASLFSSAYVTPGIPGYADALIAMQHVATQPNVRAVNNSWAKPRAMGTLLDGDSQLTLGLDWSARVHNVLYAVAGNQDGDMLSVPTDNFNGITVAASARVGGAGAYRQVAGFNRYDDDAEVDRVSISLIAPGKDVELTDLGSVATPPPLPFGTSFAAPHVTGTVALLQELATRRINAAAPRFDMARARRHEVMKAVLINSADKLIDNNTVMVGGNPVPQGGLLGMGRTIIDQQGMNWLQSEAYNDGVGEGGGFIPLDDQMGAGHLNAMRALQQFDPGEYESDSGDVPVIGWDYGHTAMENDINRYPLAGMLTQNHFISITLAWDRQVEFDVDVDMDGQYDIGDTFQESMVSFPTPDSDDLINNLDIFLLPKGAATITQAVAESVTAEGTLQHIFFQIPATDEYEIWVRQFDADIAGGQDYALAWWYGVAPPLVVQGDYNGDSIVNAADYTVWRSGFGSSVAAGTGADGNGNGVIDAADYVVWRNSATAGSGSLATVPEPSGLLLLVAAGV